MTELMVNETSEKTQNGLIERKESDKQSKDLIYQLILFKNHLQEKNDPLCHPKIYPVFFDGVRLYNQKQVKEAGEVFISIIDPILQSIAVRKNHSVLTVILSSLKAVNRADIFVEALIADDEKLSLELLYEVGSYYRDENKIDLAKKYFLKTLERNRFYKRSLYSLSLCLIEEGDFKNALEKMELLVELARNDEKALNIYMKKILEIVMLRKGECLSCGGPGNRTCCSDMVLRYNGKNIQSFSDYCQLIMNDEHNESWIPGRVTAKGEILFSCKHFKEDCKCGNYENRPRLCRTFPENFISLLGFPHCSYSFELRKDLAFTSYHTLNLLIIFLREYKRDSDADYLAEKLTCLT